MAFFLGLARRMFAAEPYQPVHKHLALMPPGGGRRQCGWGWTGAIRKYYPPFSPSGA